MLPFLDERNFEGGPNEVGRLEMEIGKCSPS